MKRAVLYARVSGDDRLYKTSGIDNQLADCRRYAASRGYKVVGEHFEDPNAHTSGTAWLPAIEKIMESAEQHEFDVLIVRELDRLSRDRLKHLVIKHHMEENHISIEYVIGQFANSDEGEFQEGVMREFAHYQRKQLTRKLHRGIRDNVRRGNIKTGGCASPYGYDLKKIDNNWRLVINEQEAEVVRLIFNLYINEGLGGYLIAKKLDELGIVKPRKGKAHIANVTRKTGRWSGGSVGGVLRNEVYIGNWYYRKTRRTINPKTGKTKLVRRPKEEWILVKVPRMISDLVFEAAQEQSKKNRRHNGKQYRYIYTVGGMVTCGRCGKRLSGVTQAAAKNPYAYYICNARRNPKEYGYWCELPYFKVALLDATIWNWVKTILLEPERLQSELERYGEQHEATLKPYRKTLQTTEKKLKGLEEQKERLIKAYTAGVLTLEEISNQKEAIDYEIKYARQTVSELETTLQSKRLTPEHIQSISAFAARVGAGADLSDSDPATQRKIYKLLNLEAILDGTKDDLVADVRCLVGQSLLSVNV